MLRIGISACLLGESVRYDGGHKRHATLIETLGGVVEWIPVCPEVECGMGTPREPVRLVRTAGGLRMLGVESGIDHTARMTAYARDRAEALARAGICGYVLKKRSPSCGLAGVQIFDEEGRAVEAGRGLFAEALVARLPGLPVEEEDRLMDPRLCELFLAQARRFQDSRGATSPPSPRSR